jgi:integrase
MSLDQLATRIKAEHRHAVQTVRKSLEHARTAGELLAQAREQIKDSPYRWGKWVEQECGIQERTASNYLRLFRRWSEVEQQAGDVSALTVRAALALLKKRSRPPKPSRPGLTPADLGRLMDKFGISGKPDRLLALLKELGVAVSGAKAAPVAAS